MLFLDSLKETRTNKGNIIRFPGENPVGRSLILLEPRGTMNIVVTYDAVWTHLANPPSLNPCPNFFNICDLRSHFAKALRRSHVPNPQ